MNLASISSRALSGIESPLVSVEVHASNGLPSLSIVGLPETSVKESKDRVRSAILNSGFTIPPKRITVNLAPADLPKSGGRYDLPIAVGILIATGQLEVEDVSRYEFLGELALNGQLRPIKGVLPSLLAARECGKVCLLPNDNMDEAVLSLLDNQVSPHFILVSDLKDVCRVMVGDELIQPRFNSEQTHADPIYPQDMSDVVGQYQAKRVLEISASGHHSLIMVGPPGSGKSMLASRLVTILPALQQSEAIESAAIKSLTGQEIGGNDFYHRSCISPHHTASAAAIVGGGSYPKPGAVSLAHNGILFLDEIPEFNRSVLEALREPLETKRVDICRVNQQVTYPADCLLIAAMNPSPSGYFADDPLGRCKDTPDQIQRYQKKLSGPLLDRIDLHIEVPAVEFSDLQSQDIKGESSDVIRERVSQTRLRQLERQGCLNSELTAKQVQSTVVLDDLTTKLMEKAVNQLGISVRGYHRILRIGRTLADMEGADSVGHQHIAEALGYRLLDRIT